VKNKYMNYYNEFDPKAAAWLQQLISQNIIPNGHVDTRSITDVTANDLAEYTQCHFFAGIGGWSRALFLAGVPSTTPLWTGSCPCQPFSNAGKRRGTEDERHLWPTWKQLIAQCKPPIVFGEQVASADGRNWLASVRSDLETLDYAVGAADLCAAGIGAPHIRQRLWFVGMADTEGIRGNGTVRGDQWQSLPQTMGRGTDVGMAVAKSTRGWQHAGAIRGATAEGICESQRQDIGWSERETGRTGDCCTVDDSSMAHADHKGPQGRTGMPECSDQLTTGAGSLESGMGNTDNIGTGRDRGSVHREVIGEDGQHVPEHADAPGNDSNANEAHSFWRDADWLLCRDERWRSVRPGSFPLAYGVSARVGRLRGYGNAIVPQVAATFIRAALM
jgi:DNA (cytosine-5)-methyltransferase 1